MISSGEMFCLINCLALLTLAYSAPMGPPNDPMSSVRLKAEELIDNGAQQGKLATEAIHNQMMAANDLQKQNLAVAGAQLQSLSNSGVQQQKLISETTQNQLAAAFLQQQQLAQATVQAQKMAAEALHKQILAQIDFQQKLISAGLQLPGAMVSMAQQPLATVQSLATGQMPSTMQQQSPFPSMVPMMAGLDKIIAYPLTVFSPLLTAASNMAGVPGITLSAG